MQRIIFLTNLEKKIHETDKTARELSYSQLTMAGSFLDWITAAACKHKSFKAIYEQLGINVPFDGVCYKDESPLSVLLVTKSSLSSADVTLACRGSNEAHST